MDETQTREVGATLSHSYVPETESSTTASRNI